MRPTNRTSNPATSSIPSKEGVQSSSSEAETPEQTQEFSFPGTPVYNLNALQRLILNSGQRRNQTILALQRQYGNTVVQRVLAKLPTGKPKTRVVQRISDPLPDTKGNLEVSSSLPSLKTESNSLYDWINKTVTQDLKPASRLGAASSVKPSDVIKGALTSFWNYSFSDQSTSLADQAAGITDQPTLQKNKNVARERTVEYHLINLIRQELAASTARRLKRNADEKVVKLRKELSNQAVQIGKNTEVNNQQQGDKTAPGSQLVEYRKVILETYENKIKKAEKLAASINEKVAYEVSKGLVDENHPIVKGFLAKDQSKNDFWALRLPLWAKMQGLYSVNLIKPEQSIRRKEARILKLKNDINANSSMIGLTRYKYKKNLIEEHQKLVKADYETNVFGKATGFRDTLTKLATDEAANLADGFKKKAGESVLGEFKAGKYNLTKDDNTFERHALKASLTKDTLRNLKRSQRPDAMPYRNPQRETDIQTSKQLVKNAQTGSIKEVLEGPVHSQLRHVGKALALVIPQDGDKAKLEFTLKAPVGDPSGGGYLGMRLMGQIEHEIEYDEKESSKSVGSHKIMKRKKDDKGNYIIKNDTFKVKAELALIGGYRVPFVFDVGGEIGGYLEIESNQTMERAMELLSFGFYRRFRESQVVPQDVTNLLWGMGGDSAKEGSTMMEGLKNKRKAKRKEASAWGNAFQESLTDKEFVETGGFGAVTGSGSVTDVVSLKGGAKAYRGKRYQKNMMAALQKGKTEQPSSLTDRLVGSTRERNIGRNMNGVEVSAETNVGPFAAAGKFKLSWMDNQVKSLDKAMKDKIAKYETDLDATQEKLEAAQEELEMYQNMEKSLLPMKTMNLVKGSIVRIQSEIVTHNTEIKRLNDLAEASVKHQLRRQMYSLEFEFSGATKGGNFGSPEMIAAEVAKYAGELGSKTRATVMSLRDQYAKDKKAKNAGADLFGSSITAVEAGVNHAKNFDPAEAAKKLQSGKDMINTQKGLNYQDALHNQKALDKMTEFAVKSSSGLKLTLKGSFKREMASAKPGERFSKNYPGKVEFILDQVSGGSLGTQVAVVSLEKATRLFRMGVKYKDGNISLMTV